MGARETILKRRALFVASALQGLGIREARAQDAEEHEQPPPPPPPEIEPRVCLEPPWHPRSNHDAIDLALGCAPSVLAPAFTNGAVGFASPFFLGVRRELTKTFDVSLFATVLLGHARDTFAPVGGQLRLGTTVLTPDGWDSNYRLFNTIDAGAGAWLAPERAGPVAEEPVPTRGAYVSLGATLLGFRYRFDREDVGRHLLSTYTKQVDISVPLSFFFTTQRGATEERFGPSWFTMGLSVTFYLQLKHPTVEGDDRRASR